MDGKIRDDSASVRIEKLVNKDALTKDKAALEVLHYPKRTCLVSGHEQQIFFPDFPILGCSSADDDETGAFDPFAPISLFLFVCLLL